MNKPAVTKAQAQRMVEAMEGLGKTVCGLVVRPDGSVKLEFGQLTDAPPPEPAVSADDGSWEAYDKRRGHG